MLTKFKLVNTEGLKGLYYKGRLVPFDKIDDTLAQELVGKTHVLERLAAAPPTGGAADEPAALEGTGKKAK
ncbi:MAG: hypothetical protein ACRYFX_08670 [Janthinobacterium lividum]